MLKIALNMAKYDLRKGCCKGIVVVFYVNIV